MSRAFVRESDDRPELPIARPAFPLPAGARNYFTALGAERLSQEIQRLLATERPPLAALLPDPEAKRKLVVLEQRIAELKQILETAEVVDPAAGDPDTVRFGATVTVRRGDGEEEEYRIVGVDEIDLDRGWVSWLSPIAKSLLHSRKGQRVRFRFPSGEEDLEVVRIVYENV